MLKHTLCILNEILLQGSLSFHWHVATRLQLFHFFMAKSYPYACIYVWHAHALCVNVLCIIDAL